MRLKAVTILSALVFLGVSGAWWFVKRRAPETTAEFTGSGECRECHETFHQKWSTSWHGLAMRPYTPAFARDRLSAQPAPLEIRGRSYMVEIGKDKAVVRERGPEGERAFPIEHILGGKNVYYFLTPREAGRLQVLPLAFDSRLKEWYDTTGSMVRHLHDVRDEALDWTERQLTFNTSCYNCHVSQLFKNYSLETDSYNTKWGEPGINCEVCHGPGRRHVEVARAAKGGKLDNLEIVVVRKFTHAQTNSLCAPCHAKMSPLDSSFRPGGRFFDHYNLVTLEDRDFYPDGRDLGENFTYTSWLMSPCAASGNLDCVYCHTSSGRNKFAGADADRACAPCHQRYVDDPASHSYHSKESAGSRCVTCHMPETSFARMRRHDHSMLPPVPAATLKFKSPNACNICHKDRDAAWADGYVRKWYSRDYQAPLVQRGILIDAARREDWSKLKEMISYVTDPGRDEVFAASLLRLMDRCPLPDKWPAFQKALKDPSPLVRSSAATGLAVCAEPWTVESLAEAAADEYRVVRVEAAVAIARQPLDSLDPAARQRVDKAMAEYVEAMRSQPDDARTHFNLGNFHQERNDLEAAKKEYKTAVRLMPSFIPAFVNLSIVHARLGESLEAERVLREALRQSPASAEANFNLALLLAEQGKIVEAESLLRAALKADSNMAEAAFNLAILVADRQPEEALQLCRKAFTLRPENFRYGYTLAFYLHKNGDAAGAIAVLRPLVDRNPGQSEGIGLLGDVYEKIGRRIDAINLYRWASTNRALPEEARRQFASLLAR